MALEIGFVSLQEEGLCHMAMEYYLKPGRRASLDMKNKELIFKSPSPLSCYGCPS